MPFIGGSLHGSPVWLLCALAPALGPVMVGFVMGSSLLLLFDLHRSVRYEASVSAVSARLKDTVSYETDTLLRVCAGV